MNQEELITSLAETLAKTRTELDAMRTLFIGLLSGLSQTPTGPDLLAHIRNAIEGETAYALNTRMPDAMLLERIEWMKRLMPPHWQQQAWPEQ